METWSSRGGKSSGTGAVCGVKARFGTPRGGCSLAGEGVSCKSTGKRCARSLAFKSRPNTRESKKGEHHGTDEQQFVAGESRAGRNAQGRRDHGCDQRRASQDRRRGGRVLGDGAGARAVG